MERQTRPGRGQVSSERCDAAITVSLFGMTVERNRGTFSPHESGLPVRWEEVADSGQEPDLGEFLLDPVGRRPLQRLRDVGDEELGEYPAGTAELLPEGVRTERVAGFMVPANLQRPSWAPAKTQYRCE